MKIIEIFVASSITTFSKERKRIAAFFCDLNNKLIEDGIFCDVKFCEELDNAVPESRKQEEYNAYISSSDLVLFLVNSDCGEYTFEEFNVALRSKKHPPIIVFSKNTTNEITEKVLFMKQKAANKKVFFIPFDEYNQLEERITEFVRGAIEKSNFSVLRLEKDKLRKVTFFLGTSSVENEDEKNEILRFVLGLNEKLLNKGIYVQIAPCTEKAYSAVTSDLQTAHEHLIINSEVAFFVFFSKIDPVSEIDLIFAVTKFREVGSPKIYTYFFDQSEDDDSVLHMKNYIDQTLNHYYSIFSSVDSIKLSILLHLSGLNVLSLSVENSMIITQEYALLDVNELSIFSKNETLNQLKRRLDTLTNQYNEAADEFAKNHNRRDLLNLLSDLDDAINELRENIRKEENEALSMLYEMHRNVAKGEMNELMKKAYRLLEKGMIEKAAEILNKETVDSYYGSRLTEKVNTIKSEVDDAIQMYRHTIHIQKMLDESEVTINTILACYDTIMEYITIANPDAYTAVLEYAQYLDQQNSPKAEQIFIKAEYLFTNPEQNTNPEMLAQLYSSMGEYYLKQHNAELGEMSLKKYYEIAQSLYSRDEEKYALLYAQSCLTYAQCNALKKTDIAEHGLCTMKKLFDAASQRGNSDYVIDMAKYYYQRGNLYGGIFDSYRNLKLYGTVAEEFQRNNSLPADAGGNVVQESEKNSAALLKRYNTQNGLRADDYYNIALESYIRAAELLETHNILNGLLADVYNNIAGLIKSNDNNRSSEQSVRRYYDKALKVLEPLYTTAPDAYADALGTVYNNKGMCYINYGEKYYQGLQCLKACETVYLYWYQKNPRKNGQGLAECYMQMSNVYDSLGKRKRAIDYAQKGVELLEGLTEVNYDRYAIKFAWAYSELGSLHALYDEYNLTRDCLCKGIDILEKSNNIFIQQSQYKIILKILIVISLMIKQKEESSNEATYDLADRVFRFMYTYVKPSFTGKMELISTLYSLGEMLLFHFDELDREKTTQFYYPAIKELGDLKLLDPSVSEEEKMFINFTLAAITELSGDVEKGESYYQAHLDSFEKTIDYKMLEPRERKKHSKKGRKKKS